MTTTNRFDDWDLEQSILAGISTLGWEVPTPVQLESIPLGLEGNDLIGQARTGSGKTGAFGIPIIQRLKPIGELQSLILCPTRELANQVCEEINVLQGDKGLKIIPVYGGTDLEKQAKKLDGGIDLIVGTPGRVMDMTKRGHINLEKPSQLTLDEADRMLDMGFMPDILWVLERMENREQTMLFSATFPPEILDAANEFMSEPDFVQMGEVEIDLPPVDLFSVRIGRANKLWALGRLLVQQDIDEGQTIVFTNTKRMVDMLVERLRKNGIESTSLHGDLPQGKRERVLGGFKAGDISTIIATDVAARGLDVEGVSMVVNYDVPDDVDSYIHRIGRTGRAGRRGVAWSFVARNDLPLLHKIEATYALSITEMDEPPMPEGVERDPVRKVEDWAEASDVFGMVPLTVNVGSQHGISKLGILEVILKAVRMDELAIGEISIGEDSSTVCIHTSKVSYVIDGLKGKELAGQSLSAKAA